MARSRSILGMLVVLILIGGAGYGIWWRLNPADEEGEEETPERSAAADSVVQSVQEQFNTEVPVPVEGAETLNDTLRISVTAKGRAEPIREAQLKARASGVVARVYVQENQTVRAGQRLVQVDTTEYALALAAAVADLGRAKADYQVSVLGDDQLTDTVLRNERPGWHGRAQISTGWRLPTSVRSGTSRRPRCALPSGAASPTWRWFAGSTSAKAKRSPQSSTWTR